MKNIIILGGKPIEKDLKELIYSYDYVCRINMNLKWKDPKNNDKDIFFLNNHVYENFTKQKLSHCKNSYRTTDVEHVVKFYNTIQNKEYKFIIKCTGYGNVNNMGMFACNKMLELFNCPYRFKKQPRCGYEAIFLFLKKKYNITICGFSTTNEFEGTYYNKKLKYGNCHDIESEIKILNWLIQNNKINIINENKIN